MSSLDDPRVYFAAERTLLAWVRTATSAMGFGFVVAKFGIFLRYVTGESLPAYKVPFALFIGALLVISGIAASAIAARQFGAFIATLKPSERPAHYHAPLTAWYAYGIGIVGALVLVYLLV
jgi:putative membrane protein